MHTIGFLLAVSDFLRIHFVSVHFDVIVFSPLSAFPNSTTSELAGFIFTPPYAERQAGKL